MSNPLIWILKSPIRIFVIAGLGSLALVGCDKEQEPTFREISQVEFPPPPEGEWFYRDTLTIPPRPLPEPIAQGKTYDLLVNLAGKDVLEMESALDAIALPDETSFPQYRAALQHEAPSVRYGACALLGRGQHPGTAAALMHVLQDDEEDVALLALDGIIDQGELWTMPRIIKTFGQHVNNPHLSVRIRAASRLIEWGNYAGVPILIKMLKEKTPIADEINREWEKRDRVAWEKDFALEALVGLSADNFGYHPDASIEQQVKGAEQFEAWWDQSRKEFWSKTPAWDDADLNAVIHRIIGALATFQLRNVDNSRYLLTHLGPPVVPQLSRGIEQGSFYLRFHGLEVLAGMASDLAGAPGDTAMQSALLSLRDPETPVREQAATTLGALNREDAVSALRLRLEQDPEVGVQKAAALALGRIGGPDSIDGLRAALGRPNLPDFLRVGILASLVTAGEKDALESFLTGLKSESTSLRLETLDVLILLTGKDFGLKPPIDPPPEDAVIAEVRRGVSDSLNL